MMPSSIHTVFLFLDKYSTVTPLSLMTMPPTS